MSPLELLVDSEDCVQVEGHCDAGMLQTVTVGELLA